MTTFKYSIGRQIEDSCPHQSVAATWDEFAAVFDAPGYLRSTTKGGRYICGPMNAGQPAGKSAVATWRCNELAAPVAWLAFDFDDLAGPEALVALVSRCGELFRCLWYPTASSTLQKPRIRIVAALDREAAPAEVAALAATVGPILGPQRDANQDRTSQPLYLPLVGAQVERFDDAPPICIDLWLMTAPPVAATAPHPPSQWTSEPVPEWRGPTNDADLLRLALKSRSAASAFGNRASFADLWEANVDALAKAFPGDPYDASRADAALAQHLAFWTGRNCERIQSLMQQSALVRDKWEREDYLPRTIAEICGRPGEVLIDEAARRREQIEQAMSIGDGSDVIRLAGTLALDEMLPRFVFIQDGQQVVDLQRPQHVIALADWKATFKASTTSIEVKGQYNMDGTPKTKSCETAALWEKSPARQMAHAVTFKAGGKRVTRDPKDREAVNTWSPVARSVAPSDASLFVEHVGYLFGDDAPRFLDWLAHIEQRPGELPHHGWVHISDTHGTGRNWLAGVVARLWPGYGAINFDLSGMLRTGFNDRLSGKLIAVVDEIREGGNDAKWDNAETMKRVITEEYRTINPKFGRIREEFNACRWLIFSNHISALTLDEHDRRFNVVHNEAPPHTPDYYARLYNALKEPAFIAGVAHLLGARDLSGFNPGAHAVMNDAKEAVVAASRSDADEALVQLVRTWPVDVIHTSALGELITGQPGGKVTRGHMHALERRGIKPYRSLIKLEGAAVRVSLLRNVAQWKDADPMQIRAELGRGPALKSLPLGGVRTFLDNLTAA